MFNRLKQITMRQITQLSTNAFLNHQNFKQGNMLVINYDDEKITKMFLYGNKIAELYYNGKMLITNAGWFSNTTKERLNALPNVKIYQKKSIWYLNDKEWDGAQILINQ